MAEMTTDDGNAIQGQAPRTLNVRDCSCGSIRILRAIEGEGDKATSGDFPVSVYTVNCDMTILGSSGILEGI
jgi:hypothetical protein